MRKMPAWVKAPLLLATAGGVAAGILLLLPRLYMRWLERNTHRDVLFSHDTREKVIALTIDDGPHPELTPGILETLAYYKVRATFFPIGVRALQHGSLLAQMVAQGHELGNHLMYDEPSIRLDPEDFERQLREAHEILSPYAPIHWVRPGSGWYNRSMLQVARRRGYRVVIGSVYPYDAQIANVPFIVNYILANTMPGSIIILHDGTLERWHTLEVLETILPELLRRGYRFLTLSELVKV